MGSSHPVDFMFHVNQNHIMQKDHRKPARRTSHQLNLLRASALATLGTLFLGASITSFFGNQHPTTTAHHTPHGDVAPRNNPTPNPGDIIDPPRTIDPFMQKGLRWLADAQHKDGGWGAGSYAKQDQRDPHTVTVDPGTTAFTAMALLRAGYNPLKGEYSENLRRALDYLLTTVETYKEEGPRISDVTGTQPQRKLGEFVDVSLCAQFFGRVLPTLADAPTLKARVEKALDKCVRKIENSQKEDGSWNHGGWAPVLQSSMANNALEIAQENGRAVNDSVLERSREYQKGNYDASTKSYRADAGAGVELYANSSGQRAAAKETKRAKDIVVAAKQQGKLRDEDDVTTENLVKAGLSTKEASKLARAFDQNGAAVKKLDDEQMLSGFGNNGGEEFLSYMLSSESLVVTGGEDWRKWNDKMHTRLEKIQNGDGSWSGHHCITSPVFCTAAVILCLTADRDAEMLRLTSGKGGTTGTVQ